MTALTSPQHRPGCEALGGYGHGVGPCSCGATTSTGHGADMAAEIKRLADECARRLLTDNTAQLRKQLHAATDEMAEALRISRQSEKEAWRYKDELEEARQLAEHKVIACGVAARHPDPLLASSGPYANDWDSPQAEEVRKLRADRDRLAAMASCAKQGEPVAWLRNLTDPQPHAVTNLAYLSAADVGAGVRYAPVYAAAQSADAGEAQAQHDNTVFERGYQQGSLRADRLCQDEPGSGAQGLSRSLASKPDARHVVREGVAEVRKPLTDERERFEKFFRWSRAGKGKTRLESMFKLMPCGDYAEEHTQRHWWTWQVAAGATNGKG